MSNVKQAAYSMSGSGSALVAWHKKCGKGPRHGGWGKSALDPATMTDEDMLGLNHGLSRTVVIDADLQVDGVDQ